ncbi:protein phosphatase 1 regulatory subunit 1C [Mirounga angustirostris]|uniref:protein phosphatase 1 regulatory subunit 1C n=1 Tax=Mirounga angustirostris TaxID=9716 RepID=UPI00313B0B99
MEPNSPKKIQFAVPLFQSQIAPEAAEQIRKRRPTPASLVILNEHNPPEIDDKRVTNTQAESQNASPKQRKQSVYTPPAMKGTVQVLFRVAVSVEFMAGRLSLFIDHMLDYKLDLVLALQLDNVTFNKIFYPFKT